ncbi:MAG: hypothetical protein ABSG73_13300 [Candidatus Aminicenantales bacterium]|jgi:hypothetical protein
MADKIYVVRHPDPTFRGFAAGIDFYGGKGTTTSIQSAMQAVKGAGCVIENPDHAVEVQDALKGQDQAVQDAAKSKAEHERLFEQSAAVEHLRKRG